MAGFGVGGGGAEMEGSTGWRGLEGRRGGERRRADEVEGFWRWRVVEGRWWRGVREIDGVDRCERDDNMVVRVQKMCADFKSG